MLVRACAFCVVEEGNDGMCAVLGLDARVVLTGEVGGARKLEVGLHTSKAPDDVASGAGDFVDGVGVSRGEEEVAVGEFIDCGAVARL